MNGELKERGFKFNKALGQNFISDSNLLRAIVSDAGITSDDTVVEIGAGAGSLTRELCKVAAKVITFEVDSRLLPILEENLSDFDNLRIVMQDILKLHYGEFADLVSGKFKVVANLPYYITTPIIFYFLESALEVDSMTVMVQKEVAERMVAPPGGKCCGALTLAIAARAGARLTRMVGRNNFYPPPSVDSAVVRMDINNPFNKMISRVIRAIFAFRRKTLFNNLAVEFRLSRAVCSEILAESGLDAMVRGEALAIDNVRKLAVTLCKRLGFAYN